MQIYFRKNQTESYLNPLWLLPKVVVPFSIGALDAQNQCSLPASSTAAAPATPFFYSEPLKMRSAPPFPQCIISQPEFLLSRMNPEFKLVELSQKHFPSLPPSSLLPQSGGREGFMKCLYCPKLVPKVMLKSERVLSMQNAAPKPECNTTY